MSSVAMAVLANHLWQSTLFAIVIGGLALLLRRNSARVRYSLWLVASLKFLVPFALLAALGAQIPWQPEAAEANVVTTRVLDAAGTFAAPMAGDVFYPQPFAPVRDTAPAATPDLALLIGGLLWATGAAFVGTRWLVRWVAIRRTLRKSVKMMGVDFPASVRATAEQLEPGIVGVFRPVLLLPAGIEERLTPEQLRAVLAHERCHLRWRDNLAATFHMLVETLFWYHPLVWWMGARLVEERERACDEQVVLDGHAPRSYAEGILAVCEHYIASRLLCVSGVSGADLRQRVESIVRNTLTLKLNRTRKLVLAAIAICAVTAPIAAGIISGSAVQMLTSSAYSAAMANYWRLTSTQYQEFTAANPVPGAALSCPAPGSEIAQRQKALAATVAKLSASDGEKVLLFAVAANSVTDVRRLLADGAARSGDGFLRENSLVHIAAQLSDVAVLEVLANAGFGVDGWGGPFGNEGNGLNARTPIMAAISAGRLDNVRWLIEHGADAGAVNEGGTSALILAMVSCGNRNLVNKLLEAGAIPNEKALKIAKHMGFTLAAANPTAVGATATPSAVMPATRTAADTSCPLAAPGSDGGVLIAWTKGTGAYSRYEDGKIIGPFQPVALIDGITIRETRGAGIAPGQSFWRATNPQAKPVEIASAEGFFWEVGPDGCVYTGTLTERGVPSLTLLTGKPLPGAFRAPTEQEKIAFRARHLQCSLPPDYDTNNPPPCQMAELLAVSDINKNGKPDYWSTEVYAWDTGLSVWEYTDAGTLTPLLQVCPGCGD